MSENMNLTYLCGIVLVLEKLNVHMRYETIFFIIKKYDKHFSKCHRKFCDSVFYFISIFLFKVLEYKKLITTK